jgi:hypothetical protein
MLYDIWSVRENGDERSLVIQRLSNYGRPEGFEVRYLGSEDIPDHETVLSCTGRRDLVERELRKVYLDVHPLKRGSIARAVFDRFGLPRLDKSESWLYWARRMRDHIMAEMRRRGYSRKRMLAEGPEILRELWRI